MGQIINAICKNCGFQKEFFFGAGMSDFKENCAVPAINKETEEFVIENYFTKSKSDLFVFYNHSDMYKGSINDGNHMWGNVYIKEKHNFCPKCKLFKLNFECFGLFD